MERELVIGGALWFAGAAPGRHDFLRYVDYMAGALDEAGVDVRLGVEADVDAILAEGPDHVIVAAGAEPIIPRIAEEATHPNIVMAEDVLSGQVVLDGDVVVVGGGSVGAETALDIAERDSLSPDVAAFLIVNGAEELETIRDLLIRPKRRIHICDMLPKIAKDMGKTTRWTILQDLERRGIELHKKAEVLSITEEGVTIRNPDGQEELLACGTVVIAVGYRARTALVERLEEAKVPATPVRRRRLPPPRRRGRPRGLPDRAQHLRPLPINRTPGNEESSPGVHLSEQNPNARSGDVCEGMVQE